MKLLGCFEETIVFIFRKDHMNCAQWWLVTVIRGGAETPNKDFMKTKKHHFFYLLVRTVMMYNISLFAIHLCDFHILLHCSGMLWSE